MYVETTYNKEMRSYFYEVGSCHTRDLCTNLSVKYSFEVSLTRIYPAKFHFYLYFKKNISRICVCVCVFVFSYDFACRSKKSMLRVFPLFSSSFFNKEIVTEHGTHPLCFLFLASEAPGLSPVSNIGIVDT